MRRLSVRSNESHTGAGFRGKENIMRTKLVVGSLLLAFAMTVSSSAGIIFSIGIAPPPLPIYEQTVCPGDGYMWTPGFWAYSDDGGYFWVPGTWVLAPEPGLLWTPGWWGWDGAFFVFHEGYWGPLVGFYGGIVYGFGYGGFGYEGGYWRNGAFFYNRSVNNVINVTNVYNKTVIVNTTVRNVSYNGGEGGTTARPTAAEESAARERHIAPVAMQREHVERASTNRQLFESMNHGRPPVAATARPAEFNGRAVVQARSAGPSYRPPTERSTTAHSAGPIAPTPAPTGQAPPVREDRPAPQPQAHQPPRVEQPVPQQRSQQPPPPTDRPLAQPRRDVDPDRPPPPPRRDAEPNRPASPPRREGESVRPSSPPPSDRRQTEPPRGVPPSREGQ